MDATLNRRINQLPIDTAPPQNYEAKVQTVGEKILNIRELLIPDTYRAVLAEFVGTFFLVFFGCGVVVAAEFKEWGQAGPVAINITFGVLIASLVWAFAHVSGCNINPAVSLALLVTGFQSVTRTVLYIIAQIIGGLFGAAFLYLLTPGSYFSKEHSFGTTNLAQGVHLMQGFFWEFFATMFLLIVVLATLDSVLRKDQYGSGPLHIGLCIIVLCFSIGGFTGASMNPARSFAPAVIAGKWDYHYVYWFGPILGGCVGAVLYKFVIGKKWAPPQQTESISMDQRYSTAGLQEQRMSNVGFQEQL